MTEKPGLSNLVQDIVVKCFQYVFNFSADSIKLPPTIGSSFNQGGSIRPIFLHWPLLVFLC